MANGAAWPAEEVLSGLAELFDTGVAVAVGDDEPAADEQGVGEHAPGVDLVGVRRQQAEDRAQPRHPAAVDAAIAWRPLAHGELDGEVGRRRQLEEVPDHRSRVVGGGADLGDDVVDHRGRPGSEHLVEQGHRSW